MDVVAKIAVLAVVILVAPVAVRVAKEAAQVLHAHTSNTMSKRRVVFIVTQDCQLRCNYCYLVGKNKAGRMTWETAKLIVDFLMSLPVKEDEAVFDFIGGEPLLEIDLIDKVSDYIVERMEKVGHVWLKQYSFRFTTNGLNYSSEKVQKYIEKNKNHLSIQMSIDGTKKKHDLNRVFLNGKGSYDQVLPNVKKWVKQFDGKALSMLVISHDDLPYLSESIIHHISLGIKNIYVGIVVEDVWREGDGLIFEKELIATADYIINHRLWKIVEVSPFRQELGTPETEEHLYPCGIPEYVFDSQGKIYSCIRFANYSLRDKKPRIIGTIDTGIDFNKLRPLLAFDRESSYPKKCLNCEIASGCRWCPAENYDSSDIGTIFQRTTTVCELHKANVRAKNYYWNRICYLEENGR